MFFLLHNFLNGINIIIIIKSNKFTKKKKVRPINEITEDDINFFLSSIKNVSGYPKVRNLQKLLQPTLNLVKINAILKYLERSRRLEIDLDGNIIWIGQEKIETNRAHLAEVANISKDFVDYFSTKNRATEENDS